MPDPAGLPPDILYLVLARLPPQDVVACRLVSRTWHRLLTADEASAFLLRRHFPRARESRLAAAAAARSSLGASPPPPEVPPPARTYALVARRYRNLGRAAFHAVDRVPADRGGRHFRAVAPWARHLRVGAAAAPLHRPDPAWSYDQEDGLLAYRAPAPPVPAAAVEPGCPDEADGRAHPFRVLDVATGRECRVPFRAAGRVVRRVRLAHGVLALEWAEAAPCRRPAAGGDPVHRHFITAYDVGRERAPAPGERGDPAGSAAPRWSVAFRSEWEMVRRGLPLNDADRFFSAHTATHYAVYVWRPGRPAGDGAGAGAAGEPSELLLVWDMARPADHRRPPGDPAGPGRPALVRRLGRRALGFYGARQGTAPRLRGLALDERNLYVVEEEHRWAAGPQAPARAPRAHRVRSTGIPVIPPPADPDLPGAAAAAAAADPGPGPVQGPRWVDECGADGGANMAFCRRAQLGATAWEAAGHGRRRAAEASGAALGAPRPPCSAGHPFVSASRAPCAGARAGATTPTPTTTTTTTPPATTPPPTRRPPPAAAADRPPPRWPGRAPCWRHEAFPYLTEAEVADPGAGLRVSARACVLLQAVSARPRPALLVRGLRGWGPAYDDDEDDDDDDEGWGEDGQGGGGGGGGGGSPAGAVEFPEEAWRDFMGGGHIAGDERWLVGEDMDGAITIGRF